jgi:uncharacterized protein (TIGR03435 family)
MDFMVDAIRDFAGRPVVDKTGLTGTYDFKLEAPLAFRLHDAAILTAVQDQLGLRLEAERAMVETLVVDHLEEPSPN